MRIAFRRLIERKLGVEAQNRRVAQLEEVARERERTLMRAVAEKDKSFREEKAQLAVMAEELNELLCNARVQSNYGGAQSSGYGVGGGNRRASRSPASPRDPSAAVEAQRRQLGMAAAAAEAAAGSAAAREASSSSVTTPPPRLLVGSSPSKRMSRASFARPGFGNAGGGIGGVASGTAPVAFETGPTLERSKHLATTIRDRLVGRGNKRQSEVGRMNDSVEKLNAHRR